MWVPQNETIVVCTRRRLATVGVRGLRTGCLAAPAVGPEAPSCANEKLIKINVSLLPNSVTGAENQLVIFSCHALEDENLVFKKMFRSK